MKRVLTIAGSDTGGGAGVQADLKTIAILGGHGMSVITALTAQDSLGVQSIYPVPLPFIEAQMDAIFSDMGVDGAKTGMLWDAEVVKLVAGKLAEYRMERLVVDPIMVAKDGSALLSEDGREALREGLLPRALLVTPNLPEAAALAGMEVRTVKGMKEAARRIRGFGVEAVLVKGGHLEGDPVDILFDGSGFTEFSSERTAVAEAHGTGCVLSAAIATELAKGASLQEAVQRGRSLTLMSIKAAFAVGKGRRFANPHAYLAKEGERYEVIRALKEAFARLKGEEGIEELIPEVSSNLGYALPFAQEKGDVAAFPGRIIRLKGTIATANAPEFGTSQHIASVILTVMRHDFSCRSAMNIRFSPPILQACQEGGLHILGFDRAEEPQEVRQQEGLSLAWGVGKVLAEAGEVPDVVYDEGGWGKESMIRVLGRDPGEVAQRVIEINRVLKGRRPSKLP
ncbi:MAG: bifunctional hydroxymethylpyrimidine kinase/phosphomethylpyrimidine kinase [Deltaproteobacteria bacterium]|nr:bifunctional hydroxymethylpyrimidine kinase/phosphomethylpyrimidine kinase [Deltaproteobacteria bacterium]